MLDRRFSLAAVLMVSSALASCGRQDDQGWNATQPARYCVDRQGQRVPDQQCNSGGAGVGNAFLWYYLGSLNSQRSYYVPPIGGSAVGGSFRPAAGVPYVSAPLSSEEGGGRGFTPVSRGGFGATGEGIGAGE
jgi:hypothetical protein